ncbi:PREDICTED: F-box protein At1g49990-like [Camelina sativa]|uniref:F-box protein At1g49990-like n=1 Tax=Camelina sativa TaxID=90675 RepID=A0ABM0TD61_CAMSA|nr:PREDICTED: F-box protein At1g49990-like [Camelina sativa]
MEIVNGVSLLRRSLPTVSKNKIKKIRVVSYADGLVLLRLKEEEEEDQIVIRYYVGNPVLAQWIQLPPSSPDPPRNASPYPGHYTDTGLVTRMRNGALLGYKVVRINSKAWHPFPGYYSQTWSFEVFSSDKGEWSVEQVSCPVCGVSMRNVSNPGSLNGKLHWLDGSRRVIVHDFFSCDDQVRALPLPAMMESAEWLRSERRRRQIDKCPLPLRKKICTTSQGDFVIIDVGSIDEVKSYNVRVMRLKTDSWNWEKAWEINMSCVGLGFKCVPMAINCFDINIIYLWDLDRNCFLACNIRTHKILCDTRKDGAAYNPKYFCPIFREDHITREDGTFYKEDTFCYEPRSSLLHFVLSLQVIPT